jgi:DNA repair protein RadC
MKPLLVSEIMHEDLPREKLERLGPQSLTESELLALLLRTGIKGKNVLQLSKEILNEFSTRSVSQKTFIELQKIKGISKGKASIIIAAFELSRRLSQKPEKKIAIGSSESVFNYLREEMGPLHEEIVVCLLVDTKMNLLKRVTISYGTLTYSHIEPRKIIQKVIEYNAFGFFLVHNHPSGDSNPSQNDRITTKKIKEIANLMHIAFLDHVIIGDSYYSFYDNDNL